MASLTRAMDLAHTIWGGRFCPIIPADDFVYGRQLVDCFQVDALYPVLNAGVVGEFANRYPHLQWPFFDKDFFVEKASDSTGPQLLSVLHPLRHFEATMLAKQLSPTPVELLWDETDPLGPWLSAASGRYIQGSADPNYSSAFHRTCGAVSIHLKTDAPLPAHFMQVLTPNGVTSWGVQGLFFRERGIYVARGCGFADLVNYWNLRASGKSLLFCDIEARDRTQAALDHFATNYDPKTGKNYPEPLPVYGTDEDLFKSLQLRDSIFKKFSYRLWNHPVRRPGFALQPRSVLANVDSTIQPPVVSFTLPEKPFFDEPQFYREHLIATVSSYSRNIFSEPNYIFPPPNIPQLAPHYGREIWYRLDQVRAEDDGVGFIVSATREHIEMRGLPMFGVIEQIFALAGIAVDRSAPGVIAENLIKQMGGLQGCRVFKIPGVRELIGKYAATESFTAGDAQLLIRGADFAEYQDLYIARRENNRQLKPDDVLTFLLDRKVFHTGLELRCPNCNLKFWRHLDDCKTLLSCDYCGTAFNITLQLRHRGDWRYRRSGLFGRQDHQEGGITVALALQQLETALHSYPIAHCTALNLDGAAIRSTGVEVDFVILSKDRDRNVEIGLSECKANQEISKADFENLSQVAASLANHGLNVFLIFCKTGIFSEEEIVVCKQPCRWPRGGVILLSGRDLETYDVYERARKEFAISGFPSSLVDMAQATKDIYLEPRVRV
jgi:hypothetical protein